MTTRKESAQDIAIHVNGDRLAVTQLSVSKDIEVEEIYGAGNTMPAGYAIHQISYSGDLTIPGSKKYNDNELFDDDGVPETGISLVITHEDGNSTVFNDVLVTSEGYEVNDGEVTETSYEFVALGKDEDVEPSELPS